MNLLDVLLADVIENSADDTPWFVMADWFEERDEPFLSELVRLSITLRRAPFADRPLAEQRLQLLLATGLRLPMPVKKIMIGDRRTIDLVFVPPGSFLMGSPPDEERREDDEGPLHPVHISKGFWLGVHPVTRQQWRSVLQSPPPGRFQPDDSPVDGVSYRDAQDFLQALSRLSGRHCRLPTEAEWEYACRAMTSTAFAFGQSLSGHQANFDATFPYNTNERTDWLQQTTKPGCYPSNAWGLQDMHGNVWEWCQDWYDARYYANSPTIDPQGPSHGSFRVLRGGSWYSYGWLCRSANRDRFAPESGAGNYGLRVAMDQ
jgi:uncharacterized protein (TIGR02996 family)